MTKNALTLCRVLLFCILCAGALAVTSGLIGNVKSHWLQAFFVIVAALISLILSKFFARWERIRMIDIGIIPDRKSLSKFFIGLGIGWLLAALQPAMVLMAGHVKITPVPTIFYKTLITSFVLYLAVGLREEISFRGFPLFSLQRAVGPRLALLFIGMIFIIEHKLGGMNWWSAILGPGVGSLLFGLAALKTKGLAFPFGLHTSWNFGQWLFGFKNDDGVLRIIIEKGYEDRVEIIGWISYFLVMGTAIVILCCFRSNQTNNLDNDLKT